MRIVMSERNYEIEDGLQKRLEKKVGKLDRYFGDNVVAQVRLSQERGARYIAEITIPFDGGVLRAEEVTNDMYQSVDKALAIIERQIRRHRTKLEKRLREGAFAKEAPEYEGSDSAQEMEPELVRVKRFAMKPMEVEDAIAQMEMLGHSFFMFINAPTGGACVVYRRQDGNYGLLEPENA